MKFIPLKILIPALMFIFLSATAHGVGWDWGVKTPSQMETAPLGGNAGEVTLSQFPTQQIPSFSVYTMPGRESMPGVLEDLDKAKIDRLKALLTDICALNYKLSEAFEDENWKNFKVGDLFQTKSKTFDLKVRIKSDMKKLHRKYAELITNYEGFFDQFFAYDGTQPFIPGDLMRSLWGDGRFLDDPKLVIDEVMLNARRGEASPILKWMVYYLDFIMVKIEEAAKIKPASQIRGFDSLWSLKQQTYSDDFDMWGNFWSDIYSDPRMFNELPKLKE